MRVQGYFFFDQRDQFFRIFCGQVQFPSQYVCRPKGQKRDDRQHVAFGAGCQPVDHFIYRAVAAAGDDHVYILHTVRSVLGVPRLGRQADTHPMPAFIKNFEELSQSFTVPPTCDRIVDDKNVADCVAHGEIFLCELNRNRGEGGEEFFCHAVP